MIYILMIYRMNVIGINKTSNLQDAKDEVPSFEACLDPDGLVAAGYDLSYLTLFKGYT